jgi:hypothetical protein
MKNLESKMFDGIRKGDLVTLNTPHASYIGIWGGIEKAEVAGDAKIDIIRLASPHGVVSLQELRRYISRAESRPARVREAVVDPAEVASVFYESPLLFL